jgi:plastocyanin
MSSRRSGLLVSPVLAALLIAACGPGGVASPSPEAPAAPASPAAESPAAPASPEAPASPDTSPSPAASPAGETIEIVGVDYAFEGVPPTIPAGATLSFRNDGQEVHELVLVRRNDDVSTTFEELLQMPQEEVEQLVTIAGYAVAAKGETAQQTVPVGEPGDYAMVCFVPVGMTEMPSEDPGASPPDATGPPHFTQGMLSLVTVGE